MIIANTGSPTAPTSEAVGSYLRAFLSDQHICPMNPAVWRFILERFIIPKRAPASAAKYASVWTSEGSPLDVGMRSLAHRVEAACAEAQGLHIGAVCYAMCFSPPTLADALTDCEAGGCDAVVVIPLYPQSAFSTTESVRSAVEQALSQTEYSPEIAFIESYCSEPSYISAIADSIICEGFDAAAGDRLLFAFHSIPMVDVRAGDTYGDQTKATARSVACALGLDEGMWRIGYQCRFDRSRKWLSPSTKAVLKELVDAKRLFVVAPNFSIDCLETLYDIQIELRDAWLGMDSQRESGGFRYVPCLNDSAAHAELIKSLAEGLKAGEC